MRPTFTYRLAAAALAAAAPARLPAQTKASAEARGLVSRALTVMMGDARGATIRAVRIDGAGFAIGPVAADDAWRVGTPQTFVFREERDNRDSTLLQDVHMTLGLDSTTHSVHRLGRTAQPPSPLPIEWLSEAPENVLHAALSAPDLASAPTVATPAGDSARVVTFRWQGRGLHLLLDAQTGRLVALETGDDTRTTYAQWTRDATGVSYPRQWTVTAGDRVVESFVASSVTLRLSSP